MRLLRLTHLAALLAALAATGLAKPNLSSKEFNELKKQAQKAAARGEHGELRSAISGLAKDDSQRAVELIASISAHVPEAYTAGLSAVAGMESEEAWEEITKTLGKTSGPAEVKIFYVDVCAQRGDDRAADALGAALTSWKKQPNVARAALEGIKKKKLTRAVDGMINLLEELEGAKDTEGLLYTQVREVLLAITGEQFEKAVDYRNYWEPRKASFRPVTGPAKQLAGGTSERKKPTFFGSELRSNRVVFVIDVSGSMMEADPPSAGPTGTPPPPRTGGPPPSGGSQGGAGGGGGGGLGGPAGAGSGGNADESRVRIERAKKQLAEVVTSLPADARFAIFAYNGYAMQAPGGGISLPPGTPTDPKEPLPPKIGGWEWLSVWKEPRLWPANEKLKAEAAEWVGQLKANGATFTFNALRAAFEVEGADTIVLLSDGAPTEFDREKNTTMTTERILEEVRELNRFKRLRIDTFGFDPGMGGAGGGRGGFGGGSRGGRGGGGFGGSPLSEFLEKLAQENGGDYKRID